MTDDERLHWIKVGLDAAADKADPGDNPPCGCMAPDAGYPYGCDCGNAGDTRDEAQYWSAKSLSNAIRSLSPAALMAALGIKEG